MLYYALSHILFYNVRIFEIFKFLVYKRFTQLLRNTSDAAEQQVAMIFHNPHDNNKISSCRSVHNPLVSRHHSVVPAFSAALRHQREENLWYSLLFPQFTMPNVITCQHFPSSSTLTCLKISLD